MILLHCFGARGEVAAIVCLVACRDLMILQQNLVGTQKTVVGTFVSA
jgi:hypothetical protein